ncbi:predicted protein [Histoplasma capsulatum G186AR]|uniref:Uncharacterized protein n=1 Tax=Ajellomyces capsulatus (strain G186AR / H82 / ATCC MYA-2454 / RMSCC 2432) TaxID=447093 RepID=C0NG83_AJECG|nr:uncharacterized protein HCBG_01899 [Histoplasma capsulatum G186AR]EEH10254.1 predicted protein [Histoplasma capsulatum G186AR]
MFHHGGSYTGLFQEETDTNVVDDDILPSSFTVSLMQSGHLAWRTLSGFGEHKAEPQYAGVNANAKEKKELKPSTLTKYDYIYAKLSTLLQQARTFLIFRRPLFRVIAIPYHIHFSVFGRSPFQFCPRWLYKKSHAAVSEGVQHVRNSAERCNNKDNDSNRSGEMHR